MIQKSKRLVTMTDHVVTVISDPLGCVTYSKKSLRSPQLQRFFFPHWFSGSPFQVLDVAYGEMHPREARDLDFSSDDDI